jgi:hypothetical protein
VLFSIGYVETSPIVAKCKGEYDFKLAEREDLVNHWVTTKATTNKFMVVQIETSQQPMYADVQMRKGTYNYKREHRQLMQKTNWYFFYENRERNF